MFSFVNILKYLFTIIVLIDYIYCENNNVCKSFEDYDNTENNPNCYTNYAADRSVPEIIQLNGYPFEEHKVQTSDGYILTLHRIPNKNHATPKKSPVFLQHGFVSTSITFLLVGKDSLAFLLADLGYDVWLGNYRGNIYSYEHVTLNVNEDNYWKFNVDDLALSDIPNMLRYVSNVTSTMGEIIYIGHSLGTLGAVMFASEYPAQAKSLIKIMYLLSTADSLIHTKSKLFGLLRFYGQIHDLVESLGLGDILVNGFITGPIFKKVCTKSSVTLKVCFKLLNLACGINTSIQPDGVPPLVNALLLGTSLRLLRTASDFFTNTLRKYNYGLLQNLKVYGQIAPPEYMVENVQVPTYIYAAEGDWTLDIEDSKHLYGRLPTSSRRGFYTIPTKYFNHADYGVAHNIKELLNDRLVEQISNL